MYNKTCKNGGYCIIIFNSLCNRMFEFKISTIKMSV